MNNVVLIGRLTKDPEIRQVGETFDRTLYLGIHHGFSLVVVQPKRSCDTTVGLAARQS